MTTFSSVIFGIIYIVCIFICFISILVHERTVGEVSPEALYDGESLGWLFLISYVWPIVFIAFIWSIIWKKAVKKICILLVETIVKKRG